MKIFFKNIKTEKPKRKKNIKTGGHEEASNNLYYYFYSKNQSEISITTIMRTEDGGPER